MLVFKALFLFFAISFSQTIILDEDIGSDIKLHALNESSLYIATFSNNKILKVDFFSHSVQEVLSITTNQIIDSEMDHSGKLFILNAFSPYLYRINKLGNIEDISPEEFFDKQFSKIAFNRFNQLILYSDKEKIFAFKFPDFFLEELGDFSQNLEDVPKQIIDIESFQDNYILSSYNDIYQFSLNGILIKRSKKDYLKKEGKYKLNFDQTLFKNGEKIDSNIIDFTINRKNLFTLNTLNEVKKRKFE